MRGKNVMREIVGYSAVIGSVILATLHIAALSFYLYYFFWWFDIFMHTFGGMWAASVGIWISYTLYGSYRLRRTRDVFKTSLATALVVALAWEAFEVMIGYTDLSDGLAYWSDTVSDVFFGLIGGALMALFVSVLLRR